MEQRWTETWEIGPTGIPRTVTQPSDPAYQLLLDGNTSSPDPSIYRPGCYICNDPEFAQMGLPLCRACESCKKGHIAADDSVCDFCGEDAYELYLIEEEEKHLACASDGGHQIKVFRGPSRGWKSRKCFCGFVQNVMTEKGKRELAERNSGDDFLANLSF